MNKLTAFILFVYLVTIPCFVQADDFEAMKAREEGAFQGHKSEFEIYQKQIKEEFAKYQWIVKTEFKTYRQEILHHWRTAQVTDQKQFVEYSPEMKIRKKVDFEKEVIEVSLIVPQRLPNKKIDKKFQEQLKELLTGTTQSAYRKDILTQRIEKKLRETIPSIKPSPVTPLPIISDVLLDSSPTKESVDTVATHLRKTGKKTVATSVAGKKMNEVTLTIKLPKGTMAKKAKTYLNSLKKQARIRKLDPALLLAVTQTESAFNPLARSPIPAYGLMQIVPKSAGLDASKLVYGKQKILSPSFLYNGDNNIEMGAAYLHILSYRYLRGIKNEKSRLYCVIAAYNTGAGNVAKTFSRTRNMRKAIRVINTLTPDQVYNRLVKNLPYSETRNYVKKVNQRMAFYQ